MSVIWFDSSNGLKTQAQARPVSGGRSFIWISQDWQLQVLGPSSSLPPRYTSRKQDKSLKQPGREPGTPRVVCAPSTTAVPALSAYNCYYPKNDSFGSFFDHQKIYDFCIQMRRIYHFLGPFDSYPIHLSHSLISTYLNLLTRGFLDHPATFSAFLFKS